MSGLSGAWAAALALLALYGQSVGPLSSAPAEAADPDEPLTRARTREALISERSESSRARSRAQALSAYRLLRRRAVTFLADPRSRAQQARGVDTALWVLAREAGESAVWQAELARGARDREALENVPSARTGLPGATASLPVLMRPARGTLVGAPGLRRDEASSAFLRQEGVRILTRLNEPVLAPAGGRVHRVAALPQGGFAIVVALGNDGVCILSGLREVEVAEGSSVERGQRVGVVGRGLDGAPVVTLEFWQRGTALDPRPLFRSDPGGRFGARALGE